MAKVLCGVINMGTKITIELPDWAEERHIYILAGIELLAVKYAGESKLRIKTEHCNMCGYCCHVLRDDGSFRFPVKDGHCEYLEVYEEKEECSLGIDMPFSCCAGDPTLHNWKDKEKCSIRYKEEKIS